MSLRPLIQLQKKSPVLSLLASLILLGYLSSCKNASKSEKPADVVNEWIGKEIRLPQLNTCAILGKYAECGIKVPKPYRVLIYTDSVGCTSCDLRIDIWKTLIKEADTFAKGKVDFLFYFNPKKNENLSELFKRENFRNLVYMDLKDELNKTNGFPKSMEYQCFLLDEHNKVLAIGNPTMNGNVWELYKKTIKGG
jgi:hypothetical protein